MWKVKINFSDLSDAELDQIGNDIVKGCTGNANFIFTSELTKATTARDDYHTKLSLVPLGGPVATANKNESRVTFENALRVLCTQVNLQSGGVESKAKSSGAPLYKETEVVPMPVPTGLKVKQLNVSGSVKVSVDVPTVHDHGTIFAWTLAASADANINNWKNTHSNKHSLDISGLTRGGEYSFSAAYKGKDGDALAWCPAITIMVV
jgi:hypothetical protein